MHPPGIKLMPAKHAHHHNQWTIYNINPYSGALIPPKPPQLPRRQAPQHGDSPHDPAPAVRDPRAEPARLAVAPAARRPCAEPARMAAAAVAQEPRAELAQSAVVALRPAETRSDWVRDCDAVPDPGGERPSPWYWRCTGDWTGPPRST